ncbi:MAG: hypothetical protein JW904_10250 [Spirochaetales bacterium]|nr:hypothetical protein [Spirochaetales bacterium]
MKLNSRIIAPAIIILFAVGISGSIAFNLWQTAGSKSAADIKTPADIKGSKEFSIIAEGLGIPLADMLAAFAITSKTDLKCMELEKFYSGVEGGEIGTDSVKLFASLYTGLPHNPEEDTRLPMQAYDVLKQHIDPVVLESNKSRFIEVKAAAVLPAEPQTIETNTASSGAVKSESETHDSTATDAEITGKTTFQDLVNRGVSKQEIEAVTGPISSLSDTIKSTAEAKGVEFSEWKTPLQALMNSK